MIETALTYFFTVAAVLGGMLMLVARHPMRAALALVCSMLSLAGVYAMLGVHVIAVFQVLIYVGAVMIFMVYTIMLLDVRDPSFTRRWSGLLVPGVLGAGALSAVIAWALRDAGDAPASASTEAFGVQSFAVTFLEEYWLYFELSSVLLVAAVIAAIAALRAGGGRDG
ncbi:MAG: NADH-quinone oxidoreductase subunit J [Steroidobacteraceae bacterium]|jgi:NADH-quinone oxidoreductase subunit J|nr:NADH-quinone oxidoreductase subunit J [Steroidobacteraceae bacterium]